jgi:hypothetical protein
MADKIVTKLGMSPETPGEPPRSHARWRPTHYNGFVNLLMWQIVRLNIAPRHRRRGRCRSDQNGHCNSSNDSVHLLSRLPPYEVLQRGFVPSVSVRLRALCFFAGGHYAAERSAWASSAAGT